MQALFDDLEPEIEPRPTFLTVLCVLTFIGSGWAILSAAWTFTNASKFANRLSAIRHVSRDSVSLKDSVHSKDIAHFNKHRQSPAEKIKASLSNIATVGNIRKASVGSFIAALLTLFGAVLMWHLRRTGFYLYIFGIVIAGIIPFYLYGNNFLSIGISSFGTFFGLVFISLYALNLKALKK